MKKSELSGKTALVTGSSRGIGRALALGLAEAGANVAIHGIEHSDAAESAVEDCRAFGVEACVLTGDLADVDAPARLLAECEAKLGAVDILILNASIQFKRDWKDWCGDEVDLMLAVNVRSSLELMTRTLPGMQQRSWGRVVAIGSVQQRAPHPGMAAYAASKCAVMSMVENLAAQVAADDVTINNVSPGVIETDRNEEALSDKDYAEQVKQLVPARSFGQPEDCVGAVLLLCSEAGRYITGADIPVDGGMGLGSR